MALKPVYVIEKARWLPLVRAAEMLGTKPVNVKRWMGDGTLGWCQLRPNSKTLLVSECDVLLLRGKRDVVHSETAKRAKSATKSAAQTGKSQLRQPTINTARGSFDVFTPTWDPATHLPLIPGRDTLDLDRC